MPSSIVSGAPKREGGFTIRSSGGIPVLDETYSWIVVADAPNVPYSTIFNTPGLPRVGVTRSPQGLGICRGKNGERWTDNPHYWTVKCDFSSAVEERSLTQDPSIDPVTWVPVYETKFERLQEIVTKDLAGTSIANSAGQPFENGLTIGRWIPVWEFFQIEAPLTDEQMIARNETINEVTFKGRPPETMLLTIMSSVVGFYYGERRRLTQYSLKYNKRKWTHKRLDTSTVIKVSIDWIAYKDKDGNVVLGGLDGHGGRVPAGQPPATLEWQIYERLNFNTFLRS